MENDEEEDEDIGDGDILDSDDDMDGEFSVSFNTIAPMYVYLSHSTPRATKVARMRKHA